MSIGGIISMALIVTVVVGGFIHFLSMALKKENK